MGSKKRVVRLQRQVLQAASLGSVRLLRIILHSHAKRPSREEQARRFRKRGREEVDERKSAARESRRLKKRSRKAERREQRESQKRGSDRKRKEVERGFTSDEDSADSDDRGDREESSRHSKRARLGDDLKLGARESQGRKQNSRKADESERREGRKTYRRRSDPQRKDARKGCNSDEERENSDTREEEFRNPKREAEETAKTGNGRHERRPTSEGGQSGEDDESSSRNDQRGSSGKDSEDGSWGAESDIEQDISHVRSGRKDAAFRETVRSIVNCRDGEGRSPLHHACRAGAEDLVEYLISKGASVHARDSNGDTPLHIAAKLGPASLVAILEGADADMEACNDEGVTPSDILSAKQAAASRKAAMANDRQKWYSHLAEELSDNEDPWWGGAEWGDSERPDWEDPLLERMAESRQGKGLYNSEPFSLRDFLKTEKNKTQSEPQKKGKRRRAAGRVPNDGERKSPEEVVIGPPLKVSVQSQSYSKRWKTFSESCDLCVSYSSVPFPVDDGKDDTLAEALLQGIRDPSLQRAALRKEMLKWHPDKFLQKWGTKLQGPDHDRIVARVNGISEAIHQLYKNLTVVK